MYLSKVILSFLCYYIFSLIISYFKYSGCAGMWDCNKHCKDNENKKCFSLAKRDLILLGGVIIALLTLAFGDNEIAFSHFSFAGTITSIVLSVLAIFMTIQSEAKNENVKSEINIAIDSLRKINEQLENNINSSISKLNEINNNLDNKLNEINNKLDNLEKKVNAIPLPPNKHPKWITPSSKVTGTKNIKGDNNAK